MGNGIREAAGAAADAGNRCTFVASVVIPASAGAVFDWHEAPGALERLTPPWARVRVLRHDGGITDGAQVSLRVGSWPLSFRWDLEHFGYQRGREFNDRQVRGPFRSWHHAHRMIPQGPQACLLEDAITYELPGGLIGRTILRPFMERRLSRLFEYRHQATRAAFEQRL